MNYDEIDEETMVSQGEAIEELEKHGKEIGVLLCGELYCIDEDDIVCFPDRNGDYNALEILNWLGY